MLFVLIGSFRMSYVALKRMCGCCTLTGRLAAGPWILSRRCAPAPGSRCSLRPTCVPCVAKATRSGCCSPLGNCTAGGRSVPKHRVAWNGNQWRLRARLSTSRWVQPTRSGFWRAPWNCFTARRPILHGGKWSCRRSATWVKATAGRSSPPSSSDQRPSSG